RSPGSTGRSSSTARTAPTTSAGCWRRGPGELALAAASGSRAGGGRRDPTGRQVERRLAAEPGSDSKRVLGGRPALGQGAERGEVEQHPGRSPDLEVGRVQLLAPERARRDQLVHVVEAPGQRLEVASHGLLAAVLRPRVEPCERPHELARDGRRGQPGRAGEPLAHTPARGDGPAEDPPRDRLVGLLAPALRLLDRGPQGGIPGEERWLWRNLLERARARASPGSAARRASARGRCRPGSRAPAARRPGSPAAGSRSAPRSPCGRASGRPPARGGRSGSRRGWRPRPGYVTRGGRIGGGPGRIAEFARRSRIEPAIAGAAAAASFAVRELAAPYDLEAAARGARVGPEAVGGPD